MKGDADPTLMSTCAINEFVEKYVGGTLYVCCGDELTLTFELRGDVAQVLMHGFGHVEKIASKMMTPAKPVLGIRPTWDYVGKTLLKNSAEKTC